MTSVLVAGKEIQVKPCPFCGDKDPDVETTMQYHSVNCKNVNCGATGPSSIDRDYAVHRWNRVYRD